MSPRYLNLVLLLLPVLSGSAVRGQDASDFFRSNCYSCHTIGGGRVTGPDLKGVTERRDRSWLVNFMLNPKQVIDSGDPYAQELFKEARGVIMPRVPGLTESMSQALLDLIEKESHLEESNFPGLQISDRPLSPEEIDAGRRLFLGRTRLSEGGPPCLSCHAAGDLGMLGGGRIGPDLTKVFERQGGRQALGTWLMAPATPTMASVFKEHPFSPEEITYLGAFLEDTAKNQGEEDPLVGRTWLLFLSLLVSAAVLLGAGLLQERNVPGGTSETSAEEA